MRESPGPEPFFPGFAFLLPGLSGHYRWNSSSRDSLRKLAAGTHAGGLENMRKRRHEERRTIILIFLFLLIFKDDAKSMPL